VKGREEQQELAARVGWQGASMCVGKLGSTYAADPDLTFCARWALMCLLCAAHQGADSANLWPRAAF
jgi:4-amino-4-deoxy-L-arabinose transferase-like glycosyltransferase